MHSCTILLQPFLFLLNFDIILLDETKQKYIFMHYTSWQQRDIFFFFFLFLVYHDNIAGKYFIKYVQL